MRFKTHGKFLCPSSAFATKTLRVAKLTAIILFTACLQVSARGYSQTVTLTRTNVSLASVFQEIQRQTGYNFLFTYEDLDRAGTIDVALQNVSLREAIEACLYNKPLTYVIIEKTVVIKPKPVAVAPEILQAAQPQPPPTIHGRVADSLGNPLVGASVTIKGTKTGTKTNLKGEFEIRDLPQGAVLVISYTGYTNKEVTPKPDASLWLILQRSQDILDAPVIQAYGTTSRRYSVGSISTIDAETISKQPVTNILLAMQGQAPGLAVNATSGVPGSKVEVQLRGQNTIQNSTSYFRPYDQPLFIIDGVPFAPQNNNVTQLASLAVSGSFNGGISQFGGISPFNGINPADIESISILKDADATSIYGTQGSNGVILITTKKGKANNNGKTDFNLSVNTGFNSNSKTLKLLNTPQYLQLRKDALAADGLTPSTSPYDPAYAPDLLVFDQNKYTNWEKAIYGKTSNNTDVHASLSGGNFQNTFLISGGYTRSDFNYPGNYSDQRLTLHTATHHSSVDNRLSIDFGTDYSYDNNNSSGGGGGAKMLNPPNTPDLLDRSGNLLWSYQGIDISQFQFYAYLKQPVYADVSNLNTSLHLAYKILSGLSLSANLGYSRNSTAENQQSPASSQSPLYPYVTSTFANALYQTINVEPQLDYNTTIGKGVFSALVGASYKKNLGYSNTIDGSGYANDNFLGSINGAASIFAYDNSTIYKYSAGFARLKYIYDRKYILSLTGRRDGSSNFGPGHQFGDFGSAGAGWIFSEEKGFKKALPILSFGKVSGSYGTSGSDGVGPYLYQSFWSPGYTSTPAFQGIRPNFPKNLYNPDYSWALKKSLNLALDLGFFHDRLLLNATYYRDREGNQLAGYPLPIQTGFANVLQNLDATIQNAGWEFTLTSTNIKTKAFTWTTNFNITFNRNKLLAFPNLESSSLNNSYVIGKPTSIILGYKYKGLNPQTGLFEYYTGKGQTTSSPKYGLASQGGDDVPIGDREVKFMGGFTNTFSYKHFSLYAFFQFSEQMAPNWLYTIYSSGLPGQSSRNQPIQALDYWKQPGDHTQLGKLTTNYGSAAATAAFSFSSSSGAYSNDSYMRLKTLAVSYDLPDAALKKLHIHNLRIYANAQNLLTFTNYKVGDPEQFGDLTAFPLQRVVAFGLSFNL